MSSTVPPSTVVAICPSFLLDRKYPDRARRLSVRVARFSPIPFAYPPLLPRSAPSRQSAAVDRPHGGFSPPWWPRVPRALSRAHHAFMQDDGKKGSRAGGKRRMWDEDVLKREVRTINRRALFGVDDNWGSEEE